MLAFTHYDYPGIYADSVSITICWMMSRSSRVFNIGWRLPSLWPRARRRHRQLRQSRGSADLRVGESCRVSSSFSARVFVLHENNGGDNWLHHNSLATETEHVRSRLAAYGNDLISLGVDGLRLDAAKRLSVFNLRSTSWIYPKSSLAVDMAATDVANITSRLTGSPYITQEVIWGSGEPIQPSEYVGIGKSLSQIQPHAMWNSTWTCIRRCPGVSQSLFELLYIFLISSILKDSDTLHYCTAERIPGWKHSLAGEFK